MLRTRYNSKKFLLFGIIGFLIIAIAIMVYVIASSQNLDDRTEATGYEDSFDFTTQQQTASTEIAIDLNPSGGTISSGGTDIDLVLDTLGEEIGGVDVTVEYFGDLEYIGFNQGEIDNCDVVETAPTAYTNPDAVGVIGLYCFIEAALPAYSGQGETFATITFKAAGESGGDIDVTEVEFSLRDERMAETFSGGSASYSTSLDEPPSCGLLNEMIFAFNSDSWPTGNFCEKGESEPFNPEFPNPGTTTSWECVLGMQSVSCSAQREAAPPECGDLDGERLPYASETWPSNSFCSEGEVDPSDPDFPEAGESINWECATLADSTSCSASRQSADEVLPETSIFNNGGILIGFVLVGLSVILVIYKGQSTQESYSMRNKLSL